MTDRIGIMMEFSESGLDVSFYVNKINMGYAFKNLPHDTYYPCAVLYFEGSRVKIERNVPYPDI